MRYENKFIIHDQSETLLEARLKQLGVGIQQSYPDRSINNVYFDTLRLSSYRDNIEAGIRPSNGRGNSVFK